MRENKLRDYRKERGLSQIELAKMIGVTQQQISFYETNKDYPSLEIAMKIAGIFKVGIEDIFLPKNTI